MSKKENAQVVKYRPGVSAFSNLRHCSLDSRHPSNSCKLTGIQFQQLIFILQGLPPCTGARQWGRRIGQVEPIPHLPSLEALLTESGCTPGCYGTSVENHQSGLLLSQAVEEQDSVLDSHVLGPLRHLGTGLKSFFELYLDLHGFHLRKFIDRTCPRFTD